MKKEVKKDEELARKQLCQVVLVKEKDSR